jgi:eukaryotic-like serine/threonine-protein kinase
MNKPPTDQPPPDEIPTIEPLSKYAGTTQSFVSPDPHSQVPSAQKSPFQIGNYRIIKKLGEGGMGEVYEAEQLEPIRRKVALKLIKRGMDSGMVLSRFELERQALALMNHVNIARIFDGGISEDGRPYFVMEYTDGIPINKYCDGRCLNTRQRLELFIQVCEGIQHSHHKGIIHRDIKPSNVLVEIQDEKAIPKIIDFGIAKATAQDRSDEAVFTAIGQAIGTPMYMSPEQISGLDIDTRTDVYSLGVLLYELLTGVHPLHEKEHRLHGAEEFLRRIQEENPSRPSTRINTLSKSEPQVIERHGADPISLSRELRGDLDWITMKALEKDRARRYGSPSEMAADIQRHLRNEPVLASPPTKAYLLSKFVRRHRVGVAAGAFVLLALLVGITGTTIGLFRAVRAEKVASEEAEYARQVSDFMVSLFKISDPSEARGNSITAREILDRGSRKIEQELGKQPLLQARLMDTMGKVYTQLGFYDQAEPLVNKAFRIRSNLLGGSHIEIAESLTSVARVLSEKGEYDKAKPLLERSLKIKELIYGPNHAEAAAAVHDLGILLMMKGDRSEAIRLLERSLALREKILGPDHEDVATTLNSLGALYYLKEDFAKAKPLFERALAIQEKLFGNYHPNLAMSLNNLALVHHSMGDYAGAKELLERTLGIQEKVLGPDHPSLAAALSNLAWVLRMMGRSAEAKPYLERAIKIQEAALSPDHPALARYLQNLGELMQETGRYQDALKLLEKSLEMRETKLGPEHVETGRSLQALAYLYFVQGQDKKAEFYYRRSVQILEKTLGFESVSTGQSLAGLAWIYSRQGKLKDAESFFKSALKAWTKVHGLNHPFVLSMTHGYANVLRKLGRIDEAEKLEAQAKTVGK